MEIKKLVVGPLMTNCYLISSQGETIIIDPGDEAEKILREIKKNKVKYIILTHYHFDHVSASQEIKEKTGALILVHQKEKDFFDLEKIKIDKFLKEGEEIKIGQESLKVIHTPGHSKGSICLLGKNELFSGDTIFENGYGRTDLAGGSEKDLKNSLQKLEKLLPKGIIIYPGHGEKFKI